MPYNFNKTLLITRASKLIRDLHADSNDKFLSKSLVLRRSFESALVSRASICEISGKTTYTADVNPN